MNNTDIRNQLYKKTGGFIKGICHPKDELERLAQAGIGWVRIDAPFPFEKDGSVSQSHIRFIEKVKHYFENGLRTVLVSPYPKEFIENGIDPRTEQGISKVREICTFMAREYAPYGVCWQATNEMHIVHFRSPLTARESVEFLIASIEGLNTGAPSCAVGHNSVSHTGDWDDSCLEISNRTRCDYIGFDLYNGTWSDGGPETYIDHVERLYSLLKIPVILMEFGFSSKGKNISDDLKEINEYLNGIGYSSIDGVIKDPQKFIEALPKGLAKTVLNCAPEDKVQAIYNCFPHVLKTWWAKEVIPHTEEGQAEFYKTILPMLMNNPHLAGAVIYCCMDSNSCFLCDADDCPCETAWGLIRLDKSPKPAYYAVKKAFTNK